MILTFNIKATNFSGINYEYFGFSQGKLKENGYYPNEKRFYFSGDTKEECLNAAFEYCNSLEVCCSSTQLKRLLESLKESI